VSRYTNAVPKRITITLDPEVLLWARRRAADEGTSLSKLIGRLLEKEGADAYWRAYEEWKRLSHDLGAPEPIDASKRFTRDEAHGRR
jgi:hypothetical protein